MENKSLYIFTAENKFRKFIIAVANSDNFENFILMTIVASSIALTFESPLNPPDGQQKDIL